MKRILTIAICLCASCKQSTNKVKKFDFGDFSIAAPKEWVIIDTFTIREYIATTPVDYFKGRIKTAQDDTIQFEVSWFAGIYPEYISLVGEKDTLYRPTDNLDDSTGNNQNWSTSSSAMLPYLVKTIHSDTVIDGLDAQLFTPVKSGIGVTGIAVDSISKVGKVTKRFALYGKNLSSLNEQQLLTAIKTITFTH